MKAAAAGGSFTLRQIQQMLGLSRGVVMGLVDAGFIAPGRGPRQEYRFSFQDLVLLRTAHSLLQAQVPPRRVLRALQRLRASLPAELPLSGLRITAAGDRVAVHEGDARREVESGQLVIDFQRAPSDGGVRLLQVEQLAPAAPAAPAPPREPTAQEWFERAQTLDDGGDAASEAAYRAALAIDPALGGAAVGLSALLCEQGRCDEARAVCEDALRSCPGEALLHFNLAIALEDLGRLEPALASYARCLALAPDLADAHYNAARLHEQLGDRRQALRHYSAYRRLAP